MDLGLNPTFFILTKSVIFRKKGREGERNLSNLGMKSLSSILIALLLPNACGPGNARC